MSKMGVTALSAAAVALLCGTAASAQEIKHAWWATKGVQGPTIQIPGDLTDSGTRLSPQLNAPGSAVFIGFEGSTQFDNATLARNFIPPDTMGTVGGSQYVVTTNGSYSVYDKATGNRLGIMSDTAFWAGAGQTGANGDTRIMYNADAHRYIMVAFGANTKDLQIAVSDTDNALGGWKSTKFEGYAGFGFGATADYPTLALDKNAVYIGTNNFAKASATGSNSFRGTTLNVIPLDSLFNATGPTTANMKQFTTTLASGEDRGYAIQGVNSSSAGSTGKVVSTSLYYYNTMTYDVTGLSSTDATGSSRSAVTYFNESGFVNAGPGRQPTDIAANGRIIDTLDERVSSSVYESNGKIYSLYTVDPATFDAQGNVLTTTDHAHVRILVTDAATNATIDEINIGDSSHDYYQGSLAVNANGEVVIGYNRSGSGTDGKIAFMGRVFRTDGNGHLYQASGELMLKESLTNDYHNGSLYGQAAAGRQRWGDYSQVSLDPNDPTKFWLIGEFAREYNLTQFGHPGGTGGSRWSTWIAGIDTTAVPEPATWAMMIAGFGMVGFAMRRSQNVKLSFA
ncbi:hypothetical protein SCH01S_45_00140 [Sphingomonas changbaiensis NBRC 104936]|uniref:Ice-binding protein C-terminal domain-containing protein n=1 Tax=Sphingomonas changbaiensis NBRC 104936 TaxID=1219043 RepID=A0A0E9MRW8_9SPHN|nr:PEPxxWA-CTERM sorting domain-containing protein [Sphingomonas changbaiensis]GAO40171.1 hypothetical protein SCH01S_45_00140 [Sphingomonas changbaiensis NBRC 104936]